MIRRLWAWVKRQILLGDILAYEMRLADIEENGGVHPEAVQELRGMLTLARARLESDEFNPTKATHEPV